MTKAARIMELYATGMADKDIAAQVGCHPDYVRVAARQRATESGRKRYAKAALDYYWAHRDRINARRRRAYAEAREARHA